MAVKFSNNGKTTLSAGITSSATSISVTDGSVFPTLGSGDSFYMTLEDSSGNNEIVSVTAVSTNTLTVTRAQEGTTARAFSSGDKAENRLTAAGLNSFVSDAGGDTITGDLTFDGGDVIFNGEYNDRVLMLDYSTGRVGINLGSGNTPSNTLHIKGGQRWEDTSAGNILELQHYSGFSRIYRSNGDLRIKAGGASGSDYLEFSNSGGFTYAGNDIWHAGNDGSGSGLDADTLDGVQGASYLRSDANDTFTGTLTTGELQIFSSHPVHTGYSGIANTEAWTTTTQQYLIVSAGTDTYINGDSVYIRGGNNSNTNEFRVTTSGSTIGGNTVWHAGNDGSGSGLDADTVDGIQASSFLRSDAEDSVSSYTNQIAFPSNTAIESSSSNQASLEVYQGTAGSDAFMQFHVGGDYAVYFGLDGSTNDLAVGGWSMGANKYKVWHAGNDGSGSGLDADTVDGIQASSFLRSDAADSFTGNLTTGADNHITFGPNTTWGSSLRVGGNGRTASGTEMASVVTTDGNLHLDAAASTNAVYLNYYAGTSGTFFGSGSSGSVAHMNNSGELSLGTASSLSGAGTLSLYRSANPYIAWYSGSTTRGGYLQYLGSSDRFYFGEIGYTESEGSFRAPLFYDNGNTNYYVDPASNSFVNSLAIAGNNFTTSANDGCLTLWGTASSTTSRISFRRHDSVGINWGGHGDVGDTYATFFEMDTSNRGWVFRNATTASNVASISNNGRARFAAVGINTNPRTDGYNLSMGGSVHMNNYEINYVNQLHFNDNVRLYDAGNNSYLNFKSGSSSPAIVLYDGNNNLKGYLYGDTSGFGLLDNDGNWAIRTRTGTNSMELRCDNNVELEVATTFVQANGRFRSYQGYINNAGVDTNKQWGLSFSTADPADGNGYALLRESGAWSHPYPDIRLNAHTGFQMRANNGYDGVRIFRDYNDNNRIIQFNGASHYIYKDVWMHTNTNGIYSSTNSMHLYPNNSSSYASLAITGSKGSYGGLYDAYSGVAWMHDSSGNGGNYREANGRWYFYHNVANNCTGFSASTTSSSYTIYSTGAIYSTGNITAYSDARMKENIVTIDGALDKICAMRGVYYNKIDDETKARQVGVIAQEMMQPEACPEAVTYAEDVDEYGVSYGNLVGVLIEAVKELRQEVAELRSN